MFFKGDSYKELQELPTGAYDSIITSPPYFDRVDYGHSDQSGFGQTWQEYLDYQMAVLRECYRVAVPGGAMFINVGNIWNNYGTVRIAGVGQLPKVYDPTRPRTPILKGYPEKAMIDLSGSFQDLAMMAGWLLRDRYIWLKPSGKPSNSDRSANGYETILYFRKPDKPGRYREAYWDKSILPLNVLSYKPESSPVHPCPMPREMYRDLLLATVPRYGAALDPFGGTGAIMDEAKKIGRWADYIDLVDYRAMLNSTDKHVDMP